MGPQSSYVGEMPVVDGMDEEELPPLEDGEFEGVQAIFTSLEKTSRVYQLYPPNNKIFIDFTDELAERFQTFLREFRELDLTVHEDRIDYKERPVYEEPNRARSISMKLFRDGIRKFILYEGLEKKEILDLLDAFARQPEPDSLEDDMVTLLWEKDFSHLSYYVLDDPFDEPPDLKKNVKQVETPEGGQKQGRGKYLAPKLSTRTLSTVLTIREHDLEVVKAMIAQENARNLRHDLTTLLFEMLNIQREEESFRNTVTILGRLVPTYVSSGNLGEAVSILRKFREILGTNLPDGLSEAVGREIERASEPAVLKEIGSTLEQPILKKTKELGEFLRLLGPKIIDDLIGFLPRARDTTVLVAVVLDLARERPATLTDRLSDGDPQIVRHVIAILGAVGDRNQVPHIRPHLNHPNVPVRLEAIRALGKIGGPLAQQGLLEAVRDREYQVRTHALRCIAENGDMEIAPALRKIVEDADFLNRSLFEKQEFYRTLAQIEPGSTVTFLSEILDHRSFFKRAKQEESRVAAASALGSVRLPEARRALHRHLKSNSNAVREACQMSIRRLEHEPPAEPRELTNDPE